MSGLKDKMTSSEFKDYWKKRESAKDSKYKAIPTENSKGEKFRSHLEATFNNRMLLLQSAGEVVKFDREVRFELFVNEILVCVYVCDYIVHWKDGRVEHIDCKSQATKTPVYSIKKKLMWACLGIELIEIYE